MSKLIVFMSMSLDGFIAGDGDGPGLGLGTTGGALHAWLSGVTPATTSHERGDRRGADGKVLDEMLATGAVIAGRHTFDWSDGWGGDHHDGVPIYVITHDVPAEATNGNVHYTDDLAAAVSEAKAAAGDLDVMMHGGSSVEAMLELGLVDELAITISPLLLASGRRMFDNDGDEQHPLRLTRSETGDGALHLRYEVVRVKDE